MRIKFKLLDFRRVEGELFKELKKEALKEVVEEITIKLNKRNKEKEIMQEILQRLKSPVVLAQIIGTVVGVLIFFAPNQTEAIQVVSGALVALLNLFAGLNDPTNKTGF